MVGSIVTPIRLMVGLANPGPEYAETRHNAGAWYVQRLAEQQGARWTTETKLFGHVARVTVAGQDVRLLIPTTFMNRSGQAVAALANFYQIAPTAIVVAHDELDLSPGQIRLKSGGGHGGHNGLRDTIQSLGNQNSFHRLRIGIGHPGDKAQVSHFVLSRAPQSERALIDRAIEEALRHTEPLIRGDLARVMNPLNGFQATA